MSDDESGCCFCKDGGSYRTCYKCHMIMCENCWLRTFTKMCPECEDNEPCMTCKKFHCVAMCFDCDQFLCLDCFRKCNMTCPNCKTCKIKIRYDARDNEDFDFCFICGDKDYDDLIFDCSKCRAPICEKCLDAQDSDLCTACQKKADSKKQ